MTEYDIIADHSEEELTKIPEDVLRMFNLKMLYLQDNSIEYLPDDFFTILSKLNWLDLRKNKLRCIPKSIANHENLENLLVSNNYLEKLPNELGLVPKLRVLHVSMNPLIYPSRSVINEGSEAICAYLKERYLLENSKEGEADTISRPDADCLNTRRSSETSLYTDASNETGDIEERYSKALTTTKSKKVKTKRRFPERAPIITITSLSRPVDESSSMSDVEIATTIQASQELPDDKQIVHEITKGPSQISLKSYYKKGHVKEKKENIPHSISDAQLKQHWMEKLQLILNEQEKILQQEKNLMSLKKWREEKKQESPRYVSPQDLPKPPYDVQEEYMTMDSRTDLLNRELDRFIQRGTNTPKEINIPNLIGELVNQLKELEIQCEKDQSPRTDIEEAAKQIRTIMGLQQRIQNLQDMNDKSVSTV
ncbi:leucine-rich repeat-containing protein 27-like [Harmonia axyridis]|uniref:leucine-rich repeat-containing protein 27-like n=1 Tax=Harmonia axyridis TaxID=115357 RepID=UPI001E278151|nr:leucine-rich repeat-containing protein 27-like [Harmonia axyridis]